jgi:hypothetical protein
LCASVHPVPAQSAADAVPPFNTTSLTCKPPPHEQDVEIKDIIGLPLTARPVGLSIEACI